MRVRWLIRRALDTWVMLDVVWIDKCQPGLFLLFVCTTFFFTPRTHTHIYTLLLAISCKKAKHTSRTQAYTQHPTTYTNTPPNFLYYLPFFFPLGASPPAMGQRMGEAGFASPLVYRLFFLVLEPASSLARAFYAHRRQAQYLGLLSQPLTTSSLSSSSSTAGQEEQVVGTSVITPAASAAMSQLAGMYLFHALCEALVLRATRDANAWRAMVVVMLVADAGQLYALRGLGSGNDGGGGDGGRVYWDVGGWDVGGWVNVALAYVGVVVRMCFLMGVGLGRPTIVRKKKQ